MSLEQSQYTLYSALRLGLGQCRDKNKGLPSPRAEAGQENIETVHNPEAIQTASSLWMDKVAVLWRDPTAHRPQDVKGLVPSR